jgi:hypothetical protein
VKTIKIISECLNKKTQINISLNNVKNVNWL